MANPKLVVCALYNKVYQSVEGCYVAPSVGLMIRDNGRVLYRLNPHFEEDLELREIGSFDENCQFHPLMEGSVPTFKVHSWDEYKAPEVDISRKPPEVVPASN